MPNNWIKKDNCITAVLMATIILVITSCYSFKGITIPPTINTFFVDNFITIPENAPADIDQRFSEALRSKIRNESRLNYDENKPDLEYSGEITKYLTSSEAPVEGRTSALNRLEISVKVICTNNLNEDESWTSTFSFFENYDGNVELGSVQDELIETIFNQLTEDVFNKAFTNW